MLSWYHKHENSRWVSMIETLLFAEQKLFPFCETNQGAASKDWTKALLYESELASAAVYSLHQKLLFGEREEEWWWAVINWWRMAEGWPWNRWSCLQTIFPAPAQEPMVMGFWNAAKTHNSHLNKQATKQKEKKNFNVIRFWDRRPLKSSSNVYFQSVKEKTLNTKPLLNLLRPL